MHRITVLAVLISKWDCLKNFPWFSVISKMSNQYLVTIYNQLWTKANERKRQLGHREAAVAGRQLGHGEAAVAGRQLRHGEVAVAGRQLGHWEAAVAGKARSSTGAPGAKEIRRQASSVWKGTVSPRPLGQ